MHTNETIHDDCVVAFTGRYEKITNETKAKELMLISGIRHKK
ncbi:hypothetical protein [Methanobrevibacter sp.]|nr:hypothetical protein [Methanobrevibacter sp.]MEE0025152.1 hypothetical protein [Methanobrevibacter sp.]